MFASRALEDVPCPDPVCWRGLVCNFSHDSSVLQLQQIITSLIGEPNTSTQTPAANTPAFEDNEPSSKRQKLDTADFSDGSSDLPQQDIVEGEMHPLYSPPSSSSPLPLSASSDVYVPQYATDFADQEPLYSSIETVERQLKGETVVTPSATTDHIKHYAAEPVVERMTLAERRAAALVPKAVGPAGALRASIEDVGRELSKLTRANAYPRIGGTLGTSIVDVEKQISKPTATYTPRMLRVSSDTVSGTESGASDIPTADATEANITHKGAKAVPSSKPIPSIQSKFLIKPPIKSKSKSKSIPFKKSGTGEDEEEVIKKPRKKANPLKVESDEEEDSSDSSEYDSDSDSSGESEPSSNKLESKKARVPPPTKLTKQPGTTTLKPKPASTSKTLPTQKPKSPPKPKAKTGASKPLTSKPTSSTTTVPTKPKIGAALGKAASTNLPPGPLPNRPLTSTTATFPPKPPAQTLKSSADNVTADKPTKSPSLFELGVALTPHQIKAAQKLRVDSGKKFAAGLTALEYPTIIFELRPKVPRNVRQSYLDKFLVQFLKNFPDNKTQAIEAAVKVESDIYSEAQNKMVYINRCVHQMKNLFPPV